MLRENFLVEYRSYGFYRNEPLGEGLYIKEQPISGGLVAWVVTHLKRNFLFS